MKLCEKCSSETISEETKTFKEDLHNIIKVFSCIRCGFVKTETINIQEVK